MEMNWYIIHTYSGYENKVKAALEERIRMYQMEEYFDRVLIPTEQVVELVKGERKTSSRKFYPGYVLIRMVMSEDSWHLVKDTPKVSGFIGDGSLPIPIPEEEAMAILAQMEKGTVQPKPKYAFTEGDEVRVIDGPFSNFTGTVEEVKADKAKLRVLISIFGRATPVELEFIQVTKI